MTETHRMARFRYVVAAAIVLQLGLSWSSELIDSEQVAETCLSSLDSKCVQTEWLWDRAFGDGPVKLAPSIIDISVTLHAGVPAFDSTEGLGEYRTLTKSIANRDVCNLSHLKLGAHTGTHIDAPGHFVQQSYLSGRGVESLDLAALNGPALVVEVPQRTNITADVLADLNIPKGTTRLVLKTSNTARRLFDKREFDSSYTALTRDGAEWVVEYTDIRTLGIDYLSIAVYDDLEGPHDVLLGHGVIAVEGLNLTGVAEGLYTMHCLPLKLLGSDGAPARCILVS